VSILKARQRPHGHTRSLGKILTRPIGLPADYPMVAPNYANQRSALAKTIGLGTRRHAVAPAPQPQPAAPKARRIRKAS
jgi:hypothetical protein